MKAFTVYQPYASLIAVGAKRYETRSWATKYRGSLAIHAGVNRKYYGTPGFEDILFAAWKIPEWQAYIMSLCDTTLESEIPFGAVIATAEIVECWTIERIWQGIPSEGKILEIGAKGRGVQRIYHADREVFFGNYTPGRFAWELANVKPLREPIPARGMQGLWNWDERSAPNGKQ